MFKVYIFWMGDKVSLPIVEALKKNNIPFELGPSAEDHEFLINTVPYYRRSYEQNLFAFCSDVWRVFKLSQNKGLYMDVSFKVGDKAKDVIQQIEKAKSETFLVKGSCWEVNNGFIASTVNNNRFFSEVFEAYKTLNLDFPQLHFSGPIFLSSFLQKRLPGSLDGNWEEVQNDFFSIKTILFHNIDGGIGFGKSYASWLIVKDIHKFPTHSDLIHRYEAREWSGLQNLEITAKRAYDHPTAVNVKFLRIKYDLIVSKKELKLLKKAYKSIPYKIKFSERLIWSILFRFFTFKWLKTK